MKATLEKQVEECWVLTGQYRPGVWMVRRRRYSIGEPSSVSFDASWVLAREEMYGDVRGFLHTHPTGSPTPSRRDLRTMRAWAVAFGKPLVCIIAGRRCVTGYVFDGGRPRRVSRLVRFDRDITVIVE